MGYELSPDLPQTFYPEDSADPAAEAAVLAEEKADRPAGEAEYFTLVLDEIVDVAQKS